MTVHYYIEQLENGNVALELMDAKGDPTGQIAAENVNLADFKERYKSCSEHDCPLLPRTVEEIRMKMAENRAAMGETHLDNQKLDEAEDMFKRSLNLDESNIKAQIGMGKAKMEKNLVEEAMAIFRKIREANQIYEQANKHTFNEFAIYLRKKELLGEAIENYEKAIFIDPADEILYYNLGRAYWEKNDVQAAIGKIKEGLSIAEGKKKDFAGGMMVDDGESSYDEEKAYLLRTHEIAKSALDFYMAQEEQMMEKYFEAHLEAPGAIDKKEVEDACIKLKGIVEKSDFGGNAEMKYLMLNQVENIFDEVAESRPDPWRITRWLEKLEGAAEAMERQNGSPPGAKDMIRKIRILVFKKTQDKTSAKKSRVIVDPAMD